MIYAQLNDRHNVIYTVYLYLEIVYVSIKRKLPIAYFSSEGDVYSFIWALILKREISN